MERGGYGVAPASPAEELARLRADNEALAASLREARDLLAIAPAFFGFVSPAGVVLGLNDLALQVIETPREAIVGRLFWECPWWTPFPASAARMRRAIEEGARGLGSQFDVEYWGFKGGVAGTCWVAANVIPLRDESGAITRISVSGTDITDRQEAQQALRKSQEQLAALLRQAEEARAEADRASRAKDEFLAMLGHELRNPLAPIMTALEIMKLRGGATFERERELIERQVRHVSRLVDDLLDVSRITRDKITLDKRPVEIAEPIGKAIEIAEPLIEQRAHRLDVDVPPAGLVVDGDPVRVSQIVANLLTNAARYTAEGGRIGVAARRDGGDVVVEVTDTGRGISAELLPHVFDLFVQGPRPIDRAEGGLGLGLALVHNLVKLHGGSVSAHSDGPNRGSRFTVRLPGAATAVAEPTRPPPTAVAVSMRPRRILVVDDNVDAASMLAEILTLLGHEVAVAHDAPHALNTLVEFDADVAVLDLGLPVMDGYELARRIRQRDVARVPQLIAMTGYGQADDHERSRQAGFERHLVKPVDVDALIAAIAAR